MALYRGYSTTENDFQSVRLNDVELVKRDILNHFAIRKGEKLQNPEFGSDIINMIMEPLTNETKNRVLEEVTEILNSDPRVNVQDIIIDEYENGLQVEASLLYVQTNQIENLVIQFDNRDS